MANVLPTGDWQPNPIAKDVPAAAAVIGGQAGFYKGFQVREGNRDPATLPPRRALTGKVAFRLNAGGK